MEELIRFLMTNPSGAFIIGVVVVGMIILRASVRILPDWERAVVLRLGRFQTVKGGGIIFLIPLIDIPRIVDTRIVTMDVPKQEVMTRDNVPATVDAVVLFRVVDPKNAILSIYDYYRTASLNSQTSLRTVIGQAELDELLSERDKINLRLQTIIDEQTEAYGVKVISVEVRDVSLPETMKRAMARQAEAEREKRAKVIAAEGEFLASQRLLEAADTVSKNPVTLQLRFLQTMVEIANERSSITFLPIPIDLLSPLMKAIGHKEDEKK
ncbi:MAG: SPFH domain-containing protein [bacterium]|jgi:regulator of protease activity HflC (stomatin/prohibitin superfamily)